MRSFTARIASSSRARPYVSCPTSYAKGAVIFVAGPQNCCTGKGHRDGGRKSPPNRGGQVSRFSSVARRWSSCAWIAAVRLNCRSSLTVSSSNNWSCFAVSSLNSSSCRFNRVKTGSTSGFMTDLRTGFDRRRRGEVGRVRLEGTLELSSNRSMDVAAEDTLPQDVRPSICRNARCCALCP